MSSKLFSLLAAITLVACSGSPSGSIGPFASPDVDTPRITPEGDPEASSFNKSSRDADSSELTQDSGGSDGPDSSAPNDGGADASSPTPRFGLAFSNVGGESFVADIPSAYQAGGQTQATWEGWFRNDGFVPDAAMSSARLFAVGENVDCFVVGPTPAATEAGKVQCDLFRQTAIRTATKPIGWFHLALTFRTGVFKLLLNGEEAGSQVVGENVLRAEPLEPDHSRGGKFFFGLTSRETIEGKHSGFTSIDEFRFSPTARYAGNFTPKKHLDAAAADLLLLLDDGSGETADSGKARLRNVSWVDVAR